MLSGGSSAFPLLMVNQVRNKLLLIKMFSNAQEANTYLGMARVDPSQIKEILDQHFQEMHTSKQPKKDLKEAIVKYISLCNVLLYG